jgi:hypothetical protein
MVDRLPPPPFWRTRYFDVAMSRPDRREIEPAHVIRALVQPARKERQPDGRVRHWCWITERRRWLRVVTEPDGETIHNAFWDRSFKP